MSKKKTPNKKQKHGNVTRLLPPRAQRLIPEGEQKLSVLAFRAGLPDVADSRPHSPINSQ